MRPILIASNNSHKVQEFQNLFLEHLPKQARIITPREILSEELEVEETGTSFAANAELKAKAFFKAGYMPCFADDSGLVIDALDGAPGIHSARFGGIHGDDAQNRKKVIEELRKLKLNEYKARFVCVIYYYDGKIPYLSQGTCEGKIILEERGANGFGYDPIFIPDGHDKTFAELPAETKNTISHRAKAAKMFIEYLKMQFLIK